MYPTDTEFKKRFEVWLIKQGCEQNTVQSNLNCIEQVIKWENINIGNNDKCWGILVDGIDNCMRTYGVQGSKSDKWQKNDKAIITALSKFKNS